MMPEAMPKDETEFFLRAFKDYLESIEQGKAPPVDMDSFYKAYPVGTKSTLGMIYKAFCGGLYYGAEFFSKLQELSKWAKDRGIE